MTSVPKNRVGSLVLECIVVLGILITLSAGFAVMTKTFTRSRAALIDRAEQRLVMDSIGEQLQIARYDTIEQTIDQLKSANPDLRIEFITAKTSNVDGVQIELGSRQSKELTLVLWRFPDQPPESSEDQQP